MAWRLQSLGVGPDVLVGLRMERSLDLVVGVLGILKAGGAYLPLDPAYPPERVQFMLADSGVQVVVTETGFASDLEATGATLVLLDRERDEAAQGPESGVTPENLAYVIYTSGSTGKPKGVLISHANVTRLFDATAGLVRVRRRRRLDAVPFVRVRLLGLGDLGRVAVRRSAGGRSLLGEPLARATSASCSCASR